MNKENLNNVVLLKDMPSNIVDEAILILKKSDTSNKRKVEEYAKLEGINLVEQYLKTEVKKKKKNKLKSIIIFGIIIISILFWIFKHIH